MMTDTTDGVGRKPMTARDIQRQSALLLASFLHEDLPDASWSIPSIVAPSSTLPRLMGHIMHEGADADVTEWEALQAWAAYLRTTVQLVNFGQADYSSGRVYAQVNDVRVQVWAHLAADFTPPETGAER